MSDLERIITVTPAWDKRHPDPKKSYGIHGCDLRMVLKGPLGAVQFVLSTGWMLPAVKEELGNRLSSDLFPMGVDVGYHSPKPMYEGQHKMESCDYIPGGCYYDGSGLRAEEWMNEILIPKGSEAVWEALEADYAARFLEDHVEETKAAEPTA